MFRHGSSIEQPAQESPTIYRGELSNAISQYSLEHENKFKQWNNNYIISLSIENEQKLGNLLLNLEKKGVQVSSFYEPDLNNELTSICFLENDITRKLTSSLPLSFK